MYCKFCGTQIPEGSIFCVACGKRQADEAPEELRQDGGPVQEPPAAAQPEPPVFQSAPEAAPAQPEPAPQAESFDWSTFDPVPREPEAAPPQPEEVQAPPRQQAQGGWQANPPQQAPQNPWQDSQYGWQGNGGQNPSGWQQGGQYGWQGAAQQSPPDWQQGYPGGWQQPQQPQYSAPREERRQPVYQNGRIDYGCPMNWYKFQVYFSMIPTALLYLALGAALLVMVGMEGDLGESAAYYYRSFRTLLMDERGIFAMYLPLFIPSALFIGIACVVYGALMLVAWVKMLRLRAGGSTLFLILYSLPVLFFAINLFIVASQLSDYMPGSYLMEYLIAPLAAVGVGVLILILQIVYFRKRAYLFINH